MGYDIHITRRSNWADETGPAISVDEWLSIAGNDPSLRHAPESGEGFYECVDRDGWFDWDDGLISSKNPNQATLDKAHELAVKLWAKVQGDDGEVYLPNGEHIAESHVVVRYPWWVLALCLFSISCFVVVVFHIASGR
jgi:hypothetical protein